MCGIVGISIINKPNINKKQFEKLLENLLIHSQSRGKESSGIAWNNGKSVQVLKTARSADKLLKSSQYRQILSKIDFNENYNSIIGHARLVTNGSMALNQNNQPVIKDGVVGVHNGIVTNDQDIWRKFNQLNRKYEVDTEAIFSLWRHFVKLNSHPISSLIQTFNELEGSASLAMFTNDFNYLFLATNTGSLYYIFDQDRKIFIFASEKYILRKSVEFLFDSKILEKKLIHLLPGTGIALNLKNLQFDKFNFTNKNYVEIKTNSKDLKIIDLSSKEKFQVNLARGINKQTLLDFNQEYEKAKVKIDKLKRCSCCILPETMPFIDFDKKGVCNYCRNYQSIKLKDKSQLIKIEREIKSLKKEPDCLLAFSGGRDSSYALHYLKKILKLNPITYSYDWGMITDLGRRNQARMCGKLGVEQILHSADIAKKRENIAKNILAWLDKPDLGMIPLFMAGDKHYFYYLNKVARQLKLKHIFYSSNPLEKTYFKYGFAKINLKPVTQSKQSYKIGWFNDLKLLLFYVKQFIGNPKYLNTSLSDTLTAYISSFIISKKYIYLFNFINWNEAEINKILKNYNWEISPDTKSTWRIGDGTASFYNYIYYKIAGLTENDTFRSNQIREKVITRTQALKLVESENQPRWDSIIWYCNTIGLDVSQVISKINTIKTLY